MRLFKNSLIILHVIVYNGVRCIRHHFYYGAFNTNDDLGGLIIAGGIGYVISKGFSLGCCNCSISD